MDNYSDIERAAGIKNFRREETGLVQALASIEPINPTIEKLTVPETFNKRFKQLSDAVRHCFSAAGDIAIRDKRYLETFLTGYTNPLITERFQYANPAAYTGLPAFNINGQPIVYGVNDQRVMYSINNNGYVNYTACYFWVFKNGLLLDSSLYDIVNTAYGLKCFVKQAQVTANDVIDVVINRIYNTEKKYSQVTVSTAAVNTTYLFPVTDFGSFYHTKYLKVIVKRGTKFFSLPNENVQFEIDTTGTTVRLNIRNYALAKSDIVQVYNCINYFTTQITGKVSNTWSSDIVLKETSNNITFPVAYKSSEDFDVFLNGYKLIPDENFTIVDNATAEGYPVLRLFIRPANDTSITLTVFKNEAVHLPDSNLMTLSEIDRSGLVAKAAVRSIPVMARLGHCFLSHRYVSNNDLEAKHKHLLQVDVGVRRVRSFEYNTRIVSTMDIDELLNFSARNLSEFDLVAEYVDYTEILKNMAKRQPEIYLDNSINKRLTDIFPTATFTNLNSTVALNKIVNLVTSTTQSGDVNLVLDTNTALSDNSILAQVVSETVIIDSNQEYDENVVINTNTYLGS